MNTQHSIATTCAMPEEQMGTLLCAQLRKLWNVADRNRSHMQQVV